MEIKTPQEQIKERFLSIANGGIMTRECDFRDPDNCYDSFNKEEAEKQFNELVSDIKQYF